MNDIDRSVESMDFCDAKKVYLERNKRPECTEDMLEEIVLDNLWLIAQKKQCIDWIMKFGFWMVLGAAYN